MVRQTASAIAVALLLVAGAVPASAVAASGESHAYAGAHVTFDVQGSAVTDYAVDGETIVERIGVQSASQASSSGSGVLGADGGLDLSATANVDLSGLTLGATTAASATVEAESGATLTAHDENNGVLVVESGDESQVVVATLSADAEAAADGDRRVEVTTASGTEATFLAVGNASVTVNDDGNVSGQVGANGTIVLRAYPDGKSAADDRTEELIASGRAAGEVYAGAAADASAEASASVVTYANETAITAEQSAENTVNVTVERADETGKVLVATVSEAAVGSTEDLDVAVSGGAAAEVSSYGELEAALGGDESAYMVTREASGNATVYVAFDHFSARTASISGADGGDQQSSTETTTETSSTTESSGSGGATTSGGSPGFGVVTLAGALTALAAFLARRD
ncbi:hypothetical protein GCM10009037_16270 [Halarchaeum grantii]|uniref:PGF-CTERM protein n=1 Tax=Halarchaeum grantii TaxID=1193105 RepID=A0A830F2M7_9EURY|nr:PGF-CTERM sorting domain-containing protein [Halarchaeum grantii]GGL33369.1 hypothetical protein GCM10009037_16270 [Halarchaeum grantii]